MEKMIMQRLLSQKKSKYRKPLILKGVRQVGKTWLLKEFAKNYYGNIAYFNFDEHPEYKQFFENTKDVERILQNLIMVSGEIINQDAPHNTLIVFDEIQECPNALNTLNIFARTPLIIMLPAQDYFQVQHYPSLLPFRLVRWIFQKSCL